MDMLLLLRALDAPDVAVLSKLAESNFIGYPLNKANVYLEGAALGRIDHQRQAAYLEGIIDDRLSATRELGYASLAEARHALRIQPVMQVLHRLYAQLTPWTRYGQGLPSADDYYRMNVDLLFERFLRHQNGESVTANRMYRYLFNCIVGKKDVSSVYPKCEDDEIHILCTTVHKSKGLEYGYVIIPYASEDISAMKRGGMDVVIRPDGKIGYSIALETRNPLAEAPAANALPDVVRVTNSYFDRAREALEREKEETRVLYVAMTRARHGLSIVRLARAKGQSWQELLRKGGIV